MKKKYLKTFFSLKSNRKINTLVFEKMLSFHAKEYYPENNIYRNQYEDFNIDWNYIERDIHLENLKQDYENEIERENNNYRFVLVNDNIHFGGINVPLYYQIYLVKINNINLKYMYNHNKIKNKYIIK